ADVALEWIFRIAFGLVSNRASFEDAPVRSDQEMIWKIGPKFVARRLFEFGTMLSPRLHVTNKLDWVFALLPEFARVVNSDPLGNLFAAIRDEHRFGAPFLGSHDWRLCHHICW